MPIINGRRVTNVPDSGVYGQDLINELGVGPGRRGVLIKEGAVETIEGTKKYTKRDLIDKKNRPVKAEEIPDRTKGQPEDRPEGIRAGDIPQRMKSTFGGVRDALSKQVITEQVYDLAEHMFKRGVSFDEQGANWFIGDNYILPARWHHIATETPLMIAFPTEYPALPPIGCYIRASIPQAPDGRHLYEKVYHEAWQDPISKGWKWYCVYVSPNSWRPVPVRFPGDWRRGDNLWTYMLLVEEALASGV